MRLSPRLRLLHNNVPYKPINNSSLLPLPAESRPTEGGVDGFVPAVLTLVEWW